MVDASFASRHALVGRSVRVALRRDHTFLSGVLYGVDPESGDVALLQAPARVTIVLGHAVASVALDVTAGETTLKSLRAELLREAETHGKPRPTSTDATTPETRAALTQRLRGFLDERLIPHTESRQDPWAIEVFGGAATLRFPFAPADSVECTNEQILVRLQQLLTTFHAS